jgi:hypothetical protein
MHSPFWLELTRGELATWIQLTPYVYAAFEGIHLVGVAFFLGSILLLDLRLLGLMPQVLVASLGRFLLGISVPAFMLVAASGILLFVPSADRHAASPVFLVKLGVIALGGLNAFALHVAAWRRTDAMHAADRIPWIGRVAAAVSILLWVVVIVLGRAMGYAPRAAPDVDPGTTLWIE